MAHFGAAYPHRTEFQRTAALATVAMLLGVAFGLSTLLTPLYLIYQQRFGFSQITLTLIYAAYAIGNIAALLFFGRISDRIGRRLTALAAIATLIVAALVFLSAKGLASLYVGRILSGLGIGLASGTGNAWLAELFGKNEKNRAAISAPAPISWASASRRFCPASSRNMDPGRCSYPSSSILSSSAPQRV